MEPSKADEQHEASDMEDGQQDVAIEFMRNKMEDEVNSSQCEGQESSLLQQAPDPDCAICLQTKESIGVADGCHHSFCFNCLLKWSKIKSECPLCKQPFTRILHNINSSNEYEEYHVALKNDMSGRQTPGFAVARENYRRIEDITFEHIVEEMILASLTANIPNERNLFPGRNPSSTSFRRHIYENGLWVRPFRYENVQHHRINFARFYQKRSQYIFRIKPWLERELAALLDDRQSQIPFVLDLIVSLVTRYDMRSDEFYARVVPYFQSRTSHFIHEFYNFASSLYQMDVFDQCAVYDNLDFGGCSNMMSHTSGHNTSLVRSPPITLSESASFAFISSASGSSCPSGRNMVASSERHEHWHSVSSQSSESSKYRTQNFLEQNAFLGSNTFETERCRFSPESVPTANFHANDDSDSSVDILFSESCNSPEIIDLVSSSEDENTCTSTAHNSCMAAQTAAYSKCTFLEKDQGEKVIKINMDSSGNTFPSLGKLTNFRGLSPSPQFFSSPSENESTSPSTSAYKKKVDTENEKNLKSKCVENLGCPAITCSSQLLGNYKMAPHFSFATSTKGSSETAYRTRKLSSHSCEDIPISFSIDQILKQNSDTATSSSKDKVSEFGLNSESQSCVQNKENNKKCWRCCNPIAEIHGEESCTSERIGGKSKSKLCSVCICQLVTSDQHGNCNYHSPGCQKGWKKKKTE